MTDWLRRAGRGHLPDGAMVVWSVAEGGQGRRWRWTVSRDGRLTMAGLIELGPTGAFGRLELAAADRFLTFHPTADGTAAHGNVVSPSGVEPIAVDWQPGWTVALAGDPFGSAVAGWRGRGVVIGPEGVSTGGDTSTDGLPLDGRGIPILAGGTQWPLEE